MSYFLSIRPTLSRRLVATVTNTTNAKRASAIITDTYGFPIEDQVVIKKSSTITHKQNSAVSDITDTNGFPVEYNTVNNRSNGNNLYRKEVISFTDTYGMPFQHDVSITVDSNKVAKNVITDSNGFPF